MLRNVYSDAIYLRLLNKGAVLNEKLSETWRKNNSYLNASKLIDEALIQEHFSMATRSINGIFIMTIHKAKGKEFDEVIIWEDKYRSIVSPKATIFDLEQTKLALRVAVTRARVKTTFLTSAEQPCSLL